MMIEIVLMLHSTLFKLCWIIAKLESGLKSIIGIDSHDTNPWRGEEGGDVLCGT